MKLFYNILPKLKKKYNTIYFKVGLILKYMNINSFDLNRITYELEEDTVNVISLVDYPEIRIDGINFILKKNHTLKIPLWIAEVLEEVNMVVIKMDEDVSYSYMAELAHREGDQRQLTELDSLLYRRVRAEIDRLSKDNTSMSLRKLTSIEGSFNKLLRLRFRKILNLAVTDVDDKSNKKFSEEEKWLYNQLHNIFSIWKDNIGSQMV